jgi:hypothetical protein
MTQKLRCVLGWNAALHLVAEGVQFLVKMGKGGAHWERFRIHIVIFERPVSSRSHISRIFAQSVAQLQSGDPLKVPFDAVFVRRKQSMIEDQTKRNGEHSERRQQEINVMPLYPGWVCRGASSKLTVLSHPIPIWRSFDARWIHRLSKERAQKPFREIGRWVQI